MTKPAGIIYRTYRDAIDYLNSLAFADQMCGWTVTRTPGKTVTAAEDDGETFTITRTVTCVTPSDDQRWILTESYS